MMEPVVERAPEWRGWRIRSSDQPVGEGMVVTDYWLQQFGFSQPTRFNIDKIIAATMAQISGYTTTNKVDLDRERWLFGDQFTGEGSAPGIEQGEGVGRIY